MELRSHQCTGGSTMRGRASSSLPCCSGTSMLQSNRPVCPGWLMPSAALLLLWWLLLGYYCPTEQITLPLGSAELASLPRTPSTILWLCGPEHSGICNKAGNTGGKGRWPVTVFSEPSALRLRSRREWRFAQHSKLRYLPRCTEHADGCKS